MVRRRESLSLEKISESKIRLLNVVLEEDDVKSVHATDIDIPSRSSALKDILKKNAGQIAIPFPIESSYIHEIQIPRNTSRRMLGNVLRMSQEVHTPGQEKDLRTFYQEGGGQENKTQYFQISVLDNILPFSEEIKLGLTPTNPLSFFQSFSHLFHFPKNESCLLLYQKKQGLVVAWGENGKVLGLRNLSKYHQDQWPILAEQIFSATPKIKHFYSWCDSEFQELLNQAKNFINWTHLKEKGLPKNLKGNEINLDGICAALALGLEYSNPMIELSGNHFSLLSLSSFKQLWVKSLRLLSLIAIILLTLGWTQVYKTTKGISSLEQKFQEAFYSFFPTKTPMLAPLQQLQEKIEQQRKLQSSTAGITHHQLLKALNILYQSKPNNILVNQINSTDNQFKIEVVSPSYQEMGQWNEKIQESELKNIRLSEEKNTNTDHSPNYDLTFTLVSQS